MNIGKCAGVEQKVTCEGHLRSLQMDFWLLSSDSGWETLCLLALGQKSNAIWVDIIYANDQWCNVAETI